MVKDKWWFEEGLWTKTSIVWILAQTMWEEDRWAPAKRRLIPPMPVMTPFIALE